MSERCFVKVRWDAATTAGDAGRAVGGFLRYIQHRDLHPDSAAAPKAPAVAGLVKYVAYRDGASNRAELLGPDGRAGSVERKQFADYVAHSIGESQPQLFRSREGSLRDRRRAVSRFVISPEHAAGLDLEQVLRAGVARLESDLGQSGLRWIAAIHRNTKHHHVHLVLAGMQRRDDGSYVRVDITKGRLAGIKSAVVDEIERQRGERELEASPPYRVGTVAGGNTNTKPALQPAALAPRLIRTPPTARPARRSRQHPARHQLAGDALSGSILRLRAAAGRYRRRMQHDAEDEAWRLRWEQVR